MLTCSGTRRGGLPRGSADGRSGGGLDENADEATSG